MREWTKWDFFDKTTRNFFPGIQIKNENPVKKFKNCLKTQAESQNHTTFAERQTGNWDANALENQQTAAGAERKVITRKFAGRSRKQKQPKIRSPMKHARQS